MAVQTGRVYVPAPNPLITRPGLFQAATGPLDLPVHARTGGLHYEIGFCAFPDGYEIICQTSPDPVRPTKSLNNLKTTIEADPFVVYSSLLCAPVGLTDERLRRFMYEQLTAGEQAVVESIFSNQSVGQSPGLGHNGDVVDVTPTPGTAIDPVAGIAELENYVYSVYGLPGVIHAPARMSAYYSYLHMVHKDPRMGANQIAWTTPMGSKWSFGNYLGYDMHGDPADPGETWIYMTGQVAVWRTPDSDLFVTTIAETLNRTTNQVTAVMEREYVVAFDCVVAAVLVDITGVVA